MTDIDIPALKAAALASKAAKETGAKFYPCDVDVGRIRAKNDFRDACTEDAVLALVERLERSEGANGLNSECIGIMREHLAKVGIEATFADDVAAKAAAEITALRARVAELEQQVAALAAALEMLRNEDNCWCDGPEKDRRGETDMTTHYGYCSEIRAALRAAGRKT